MEPDFPITVKQRWWENYHHELTWWIGEYMPEFLRIMKEKTGSDWSKRNYPLELLAVNLHDALTIEELDQLLDDADAAN